MTVGQLLAQDGEMWVVEGLLVRGVASVRHHQSGLRLRGIARGLGNPAPGWLA